jgi:hypothetical protein
MADSELPGYCIPTSEMQIKSEPADDYMCPIEPVSCERLISSQEVTAAAVENKCVSSPGPVPLNLIPAVGNRDLLRIDVEDTLHSVQCGVMTEELLEEMNENYSIKAVDEVSINFLSFLAKYICEGAIMKMSSLERVCFQGVQK